MDPADLKRWHENHRVAAARERQDLASNPPTAAQAFAAALSLLVFDESLNGSPFNRHDPVSVREDHEMWEAWARLRARWPR